MTIEQMKAVHGARPFKPFVIRLADGRKYEVRHPEFLAFSRSGRTIHFVTPQDTLDHIDLLLVVSVEELRDRGANGRRRRAG
ncbi:hypothetical protein PHYC_00830 [Phycisphaerales bacterium]|nr:hypothetical protein PHYC_00830 [Phycisphaerales bacterium]